VTSGSRAALEWRAFVARAYVRVVASVRQPEWIVSDALLPALAMCAYVLVYRGLGAPRAFEALAVVGGVLSTYWLNVLWGMGAQLYWEKQQGQLQLYLAAPCSLMSILTGMALGGIFMTTSRATVAVAMGFGLFGIRLEPFDPWTLAGVFLATLAALYALGMTLSSLFLLYGREAWHIANLLQEPVFLLSGFYFPIKSLGTWVALGASIIPSTLGLDAMRQLLFPQAPQLGFLTVEVELTALAVLSVLFVWLAHRALRYMEELSRREGRLTVRGQ